MKFRITMKDPDGVYECVNTAAHESIADVQGLSQAERDDLAVQRTEDLNKLIGKWFEYGEYLVVEIDTEAKTCTVVPVRG